MTDNEKQQYDFAYTDVIAETIESLSKDMGEDTYHDLMRLQLMLFLTNAIPTSKDYDEVSKVLTLNKMKK